MTSYILWYAINNATQGGIAVCSIPETETWETQELERKLRSVIREFFSKAAEFQSSGKRKVSSARNSVTKDKSKWEKGYRPQTIGWNIPKVKTFTHYMTRTVRETIGDCVDIENIQKITRIILEEYREYVQELGISAWFRIDDSTIQRLANTITAFFIEAWLVNDSKCSMPIYQFAQWGYDEKSKGHSNKYRDPYRNDQECRLAYKFYRDVEDQKIAQQIREGVKPDHPIEKEGANRGSPRKLDYVALAWCDAWTKEAPALQIYHSLRFFKRCFSSVFFVPHTTEEGVVELRQLSTKEEEVLAEDIQGLYRYLQYLNNCYEKEDLSNRRAYVAGCMLFQRLEVGVRFDLVNRLAKAQFTSDGVISQDSIRLVEAYWGRTSEIGGFFDSVNAYVKKSRSKMPYERLYTSVSVSLDLLNYDKQIHTLTHTKDVSFDYEYGCELVRRIAVQDTMWVLFSIFPADRLRPWNEDDFLDAAKFFYEDFPFVKQASDAFPPGFVTGNQEENEDVEKYYELFYQLFSSLYIDEDSPLRVAMRNMKEKNTK